MKRLFEVIDTHANEPFRNAITVKLHSELENSQSSLTKALLHLYDIVKKCAIVENVVIVRSYEKPVIDTLEELTKDLFDFDRYLKNPVSSRKNSINRLDFYIEIAKKLTFLYEKRDILRRFMRRAFLNLNSNSNNISRRSYSNLSNSTRRSNENKNNDNNLPLSGGKRRRFRKRTRKAKRY